MPIAASASASAANSVSSSIANRCRASDCSSNARHRPHVVDRQVRIDRVDLSFTAAAARAASPRLSRDEHARVGRPCVCGSSIAIRPSASSVYCLTRPTTPTTVSHGDVGCDRRCGCACRSHPRSARAAFAMQLVDDDDARISAVSCSSKQPPPAQRNLPWPRSSGPPTMR